MLAFSGDSKKLTHMIHMIHIDKLTHLYFVVGEISTLSSDHESIDLLYTNIFDLCLNGNDLIVPLFGDNHVYWSKLE